MSAPGPSSRPAFHDEGTGFPLNERVKIPAPTGASLRLQVPPDVRYGRYVRERVTGFAVTRNVPEADTDEFVTAVYEAVANAIAHGRPRAAIEISCWMTSDDQLVATVVDRGSGFSVPSTLSAPPLPESMAEHGRGLSIMRSCTDTFWVRSTPGKGTSVVLGRYVHRAGRQAGTQGASPNTR